MQALGARAVEREPAEQDDARDRVGDLREAGAREVVVDEALRAEAREQPLRDALLEVQVDGLLGQHALRPRRRPGRIGASRRQSASFWSLRARGAQRVERRRPARVGRGAAVERREASRPAAVARPSSRERLGAEQLERARERVAEAARRRSRPSCASSRAACGSARSAPRARPGARGRPRAPPRRRACLRPRRGRLPRSRARGARRRGGGCRGSRRRSMSSSMTFERLPSSRLIVSVFRTSTSSTRSSARCGSTK